MKRNDPKVYAHISYDDLLVYALFKLQQENKHSTFENLVYECFALFPRRFQLPGYPNWPDSSLVEKSWLRCRSDKGLIYGSKSKGFTLTSKGLFITKSVESKLTNKSNTKRPSKKGDVRTRSGRLVKHIENSDAYKKYFKDESVMGISEFEFCDLLYSTLDTNPVLRRRNLEELEYHASVYERTDILVFLTKCKKKFEKLLVDEKRESFEGGMMKRRKK